MRYIVRLYIVIFAISINSCYKEAINPLIDELDNNYIKFDNVRCAFDDIGERIFFPISTNSIDQFTPKINFKKKGYNLIINGKSIVNNSMNNLGDIEANTPYQLEFIKDDENSIEYSLIFTLIPIVEINTLTNIADEPKTQGLMVITDPEYDQYNGIYQEIYNIGIEIRGGHSSTFDKKPYGFELRETMYGLKDKISPLIGLRQGSDYILDAMWIDSARARIKFSFQLWNEISKMPHNQYLPGEVNGIKSRYTEVIINGEYRGLYCLHEKVDEKRLLLKESDNTTEGLLYKSETWGEATKFNSYYKPGNNENWNGWFQVYPEPEDTIYWDPLYNLVKFVVDTNDAIFSEQIGDLVYLPNLVDYFIHLNYVYGYDNYGKNTYIARYDDDSKFFWIPWDLDATWGREWQGLETSYNAILTNNIFNRLIETNADAYKDSLVTRWLYLKNHTFNKDTAMLKLYNEINYLMTSGVIERENSKWSINLDLNKEYEYINSWFNLRYNLLDGYFNRL